MTCNNLKCLNHYILAENANNVKKQNKKCDKCGAFHIKITYKEEKSNV